MKHYLITSLLILISGLLMSQGIVSVSPTTSQLNTTGVNVTIVLDSSVMPPSTLMPTAVNIGPSIGTNLTRTNKYIYGKFDFTHMSSGTYNVTVLFPGPPSTNQKVYFTIPAAFTVTDTITPLWTIPGTNVTVCYDTATVITCPAESTMPFYGQFNGLIPYYINNGDGTVTDTITGLMWQRNPGAKMSFLNALAGAKTLTLGGYTDWRLPTIKELYSLIEFTGVDPEVPNGTPLSILTPFIDTNYFVFHYGDTTSGYRIIDSQYWSCTEYVSVTMGHNHTAFGVNFADGRIKGYGTERDTSDVKMYTQYVRGGKGYWINHFHDNYDNTISDNATHLMWTKNDSQTPMNWQAALAYATTMNAANYGGHNDWRLPDTKELESIVDYSRSPWTTNSAAIDPIFNNTPIIDEGGKTDWPWFWASTTHNAFDGVAHHGENGVYVCFGSAFGWQLAPGKTYMVLTDVHGAGAQRSSPKCGTYLGDSLGVDSLGHTVYGRGPQGDVLRVNNFVRLVRDLPKYPSGINNIQGKQEGSVVCPNPFQTQTTIRLSTNDNLENAQLLIFDIYGNNERSLPMNSKEITIDRQNLSSGLYFYRITNNGLIIASGKLVID